MSEGINKVTLLGRLGGDPDLRYFPSGDAVANFSLATGIRWKDKNTGEQREHTEWHKIVLKGGLAETAQKYLKKGSRVYLEGSNRTRKWTDDKGVDHYTTEVHCREMKLLDGAPQGQGSGQQPAQQNRGSSGNGRQQQAPAAQARPDNPLASNGGGGFDDDIPFMRLHPLAGG